MCVRPAVGVVVAQSAASIGLLLRAAADAGGASTIGLSKVPKTPIVSGPSAR